MEGLFMKLYVANVGVNKSDADKRGIKSPIFYDGTFEFIPIKGSKADSKYTHHKYDNLPCFNSPKLSLAHYVGPKHADYAVHNDPEFVTFTYGDINTARGSNLRNIQKDDVLLFLARLFDYGEGAGFSQTSRFYFVGYLTIDYALEFTGGVRNTKLSVPDDVKGNAHYVGYSHGKKGPFRVLKGIPKTSFRFKKALKVTPEVAALVFNGKYNPKDDSFISNKDGHSVLNKNGKITRFGLFHSKTRTVQAYLDSNEPTEKSSLLGLLNLIERECL